MSKNSADIKQKQTDLLKYHSLVVATLDYHLSKLSQLPQTHNFDVPTYYNALKLQAEAHYQKGRLSKLKQWFRDLTEMQLETLDLKFTQYLQEKTGYNTDIFNSFYQRVEKIVAKGKITTDSQFYNINILVNHLSQAEPIDQKRIDVLDRLLHDYNQRKTMPAKKPKS